MARPFLVYGCDAGIIRETDKRSVTANEMRYFRRIASHTRMNKEVNSDIYREFNAVPFSDYLENYRNNAITHQQRLSMNREFHDR